MIYRVLPIQVGLVFLNEIKKLFVFLVNKDYLYNLHCFF